MNDVVELRQYTLHPGQRDVLIKLFDREFVESQEAEGMAIVGQFRDLDDPDRFVWLRGFPSMPARAQSLSDFYGGPDWKAHSAEANATMIDSDNVPCCAPPPRAPASPHPPLPGPRSKPPHRHRRSYSPRSTTGTAPSTRRSRTSSTATSVPCWPTPAPRPWRACRPNTPKTPSRHCQYGKANTSSPGSRDSPTPPN